MDVPFLGRPVWIWGLALGAFLLILLLEFIVRSLISRRISNPPSGSWRGLLVKVAGRWMRVTTIVVASLVCASVLALPSRELRFLKWLAIIVAAVQVARMLPVVIDWCLGRAARNTDHVGSAESSVISTISSLRWAVLLIAYSLIFLLALQNLGVDVTALVAGLGIGGIAIALAVQNILGDLFASLTIALDRPFVAGDFIVVGDEMGTVEHIGLKTTRVRSLSGEQLVFANSDLLSSRIRNFKRMQSRRVVLSFSVVYDTEPEVVETVCALVRKLVESDPTLVFDRCHFSKFGNSGLEYEVVYIINSADFNAHMDAQQRVLLGILSFFRDRQIRFALPTQTVYFAREKPEHRHRSSPLSREGN